MPAEGARSGTAGGRTYATPVTPRPDPWAFVRNLPATGGTAVRSTDPWAGVRSLPVYTGGYSAPAPSAPSGGSGLSAPTGAATGGIGVPTGPSPINRQGQWVGYSAPGSYGGAVSGAGYGYGGALSAPQARAYGGNYSPGLYASMRQQYGDWMDMLKYITDPEERNRVNIELGKALSYALVGRRYISPVPAAQMIMEGRTPGRRLLGMSPMAAPAHLGMQAGARIGEFFRERSFENPEIAGAPPLIRNPLTGLPDIGGMVGGIGNVVGDYLAGLEAGPPAAVAPPALISPGGVPGIRGPQEAQPGLLQSVGRFLGIGAAPPASPFAQALSGFNMAGAPPVAAPPAAPPAAAPGVVPPVTVPPRTSGGGGGGGYGGGGGGAGTSIEGLPAPWVTNFEAVFGPMATYYTPERGGIEQATRDYQTLQALWLQATQKYLTPEELPGLWAMIRPYLATLGRAPTMADVIGWLTNFLRAKANPPQVSYLDVEEI